MDGWLRSGDLGHIDDDGYLYVEDRVKDMILRAGENVYSAEVEAAIYEHPAVYEAAVFGLPDERLGEVVACAVMLKPGIDLSEDELRVSSADATGELQGPDPRRLHRRAAAAQRRGQVLEARDAGDLLPLSRRDRRARVLGDVHRRRGRPVRTTRAWSVVPCTSWWSSPPASSTVKRMRTVWILSPLSRRRTSLVTPSSTG